MSGQTYRKVQMIGFALSTTPGSLHSIEETSDDGRYLGIDDVKKDISARLDFVKQAIENAYEMHDTSSDVLKIFTIPEFFFRGNKGAYFGTPDSIFNTYFQDFVSSVLSQEKYINWIFVLGTLITSNMKIEKDQEPTKTLFPVGDALLDVYYRLHPLDQISATLGSRVGKPVSLSNLLKLADEKESASLYGKTEIRGLGMEEQSEDSSYISVLTAALNYCDLTADIEVCNCCFIVEGGKEQPLILSVQKKHKSKEDFILNGIEENYIQTITCYPEIPERSEIKEEKGDPYSIFTYQGIRFGVEICLDHGRGRLVQAHKRWSDELVDVQLVISCGMDIRPGSVVADKGGIVFNCDGEYVLDGRAENGDHCHTMLQMVEHPVSQDNPAVLSEYTRLDDKEKRSFSYTGDLYPCKTYQIHVYPAVELPR